MPAAVKHQSAITEAWLILNIYDWKFVAVSDEKIISNYYIRDYSEGKVLIIKFSYDEGKEKKSIKIVFDYIAMSFT